MWVTMSARAGEEATQNCRGRAAAFGLVVVGVFGDALEG